MTSVTVDPPLPAGPSSEGFAQAIRLVDGNVTVATARWHTPSGDEGIVQILELSVTPSLQRQGVGGRMLGELVKQVREYHQRCHLRPRRLWVTVEQKSQVNARAFFTKHGFHHISTITNLIRRQDALIYVKSLD